jgi:aryl sulfotransferase
MTNKIESSTDPSSRTPRKLLNFSMDSTRWDNFAFRDGDIVIGTWAKSGTTWTQQIVSQLIFNGAEGIPVGDIAPWVDMRVIPLDDITNLVESQSHRRFLKTHLPADSLRFSQQAKYIYIGRDGRDVAWSFFNHLMKMSQELYDAFNDPPGLDGQPVLRPDGDPRNFFNAWLAGDVYGADTFFQNVQSWWDASTQPNVLLVHFNKLKADMEGEIRRIAAFLDIEIDETRWPAIVEHCSFDYMKEHADSLSEHFQAFFDGGLKNFIYKGTNGRWRDLLSQDEINKYEAAAEDHLSADCAHWLATGELTAARA